MSNIIHNNKLMSSVNKDNMERVLWPYYWLDPASNSEQGNWAVFLGTDFHTMTETDTELFIKKTNQCLDYVRKNCPDCRLIYRIHPDEKKETKLLDLRLFIVEKDGQMAEDFLWANKERVKYVFSVCSSASVSAFNMGLNSYCYYHYFEDVFKGEYKLFLVHFLSGLPTSFFIDNMESPLLDNKIKLEEDKRLKNSFETILMDNKGPIWFIVTENRYLLAILGLTKMIRMISPERKVNLIISRHHRWTDEKLNELQNIFDKIITFSRTFYSLKPKKLVSTLITARKIKNTWIEKGSVLVGFAYHDFIENCFMSYHKDVFKIAFLPEIAWRLHFKTEEIGFKTNKFIFNKASFFYSWFLEPLLGLNRTTFRHYGDAINVYFIRLRKPIEEVYNKVYLIKNSPVEEEYKLTNKSKYNNE